MYELSRNRFKEMKHFCLQYHEMVDELNSYKAQGIRKEDFDPTAKIAVHITELEHAVELIEMTASDLGKFPGETILKIVTEDKPMGSVCPNDILRCRWYLRKFYWLLSERKGV